MIRNNTIKNGYFSGKCHFSISARRARKDTVLGRTQGASGVGVIDIQGSRLLEIWDAKIAQLGHSRGETDISPFQKFRNLIFD